MKPTTILKAFLVWTATIYAFLICATVLHFYIVMTGDSLQRPEGMAAHPIFIAVFFSLATLAAVLAAVICKQKKWDNKGYLRGGALLILWLWLLWLAFDWPPFEQKWTEADLAPPTQESLASYEVFMRYKKGEGPHFPLKDSPAIHHLCAITNPLDHAEEILETWQAIEEGRQYIQDLDAFKQIVDTHPDVPFAEDMPQVDFIAPRNVARTYWAYAALRTDQGSSREAAELLTQLHSVTRKALPYCNLLVTKAIRIYIAEGNIETAYRIAISPQCTPETLEILRDGFPPLSEQAVSYRRPYIEAYLMAQHQSDTWDGGTHFNSSLDVWGKYQQPSDERTDPNLFVKMTLNLSSPFLHNRNNTSRELQREFGFLIEESAGDMSSGFEERTLRASPKNTLGRIFTASSVPAHLKVKNYANRTKVRSDLLAMVIDRRLGGELEIPDHYYDKVPYTSGETTGGFFSVGPDKHLKTPDDIRLGDWPRTVCDGKHDK